MHTLKYPNVPSASAFHIILIFYLQYSNMTTISISQIYYLQNRSFTIIVKMMLLPML